MESDQTLRCHPLIYHSYLNERLRNVMVLDFPILFAFVETKVDD